MMISYLARTLPVALRARLRRDQEPISQLHRRVGLSQLDLNLHMNQAAYAQVMELGRTDWVVGNGAWRRWRRAGINPVVADQTLIYRRELRLRQAYLLDTRAVGVDGRLLCLETLLLVGDRVHAKGRARLLFVGPEGVLPADEVPALVEGLLREPRAVVDWRLS